MGRRCTICSHAEEEAIDQALTAGIGSFRTIAARFGLTPSAVRRHASAHIPAVLAAAMTAGVAKHGSDLLTRTRSLREKAESLLSKAEEAKDWRGALGAVREVRECLRLVAAVEAQLAERERNKPTPGEETQQIIRIVTGETVACYKCGAPWNQLPIVLLRSIMRESEGREAERQASADAKAIPRPSRPALPAPSDFPGDGTRRFPGLHGAS